MTLEEDILDMLSDGFREGVEEQDRIFEEYFADEDESSDGEEG